MKDIKSKTDKELFDLFIENNIERTNGVFTDEETKEEVADIELKEVLQELCKRKYILTNEEYDALDDYMTKSKLYDSGLWLCQEDWGEDYFHNDENEENLTLKEGLQIVYESVVDLEDYSKETQEGLKHAFKRFLDIDWGEE